MITRLLYHAHASWCENHKRKIPMNLLLEQDGTIEPIEPFDGSTIAIIVADFGNEELSWLRITLRHGHLKSTPESPCSLSLSAYISQIITVSWDVISLVFEKLKAMGSQPSPRHDSTPQRVGRHKSYILYKKCGSWSEANLKLIGGKLDGLELFLEIG